MIEFIARRSWRWKDWRADRVLTQAQVAAWMRVSWLHQRLRARATAIAPAWLWWVVATFVFVVVGVWVMAATMVALARL